METVAYQRLTVLSCSPLLLSSLLPELLISILSISFESRSPSDLVFANATSLAISIDDLKEHLNYLGNPPTPIFN